MKKLLFLLVAVCSASFANAQKSKREEGIKIGIKGGLNISNAYGDVEYNEMRTSIHAGLVTEFIISDNFSLQPELMYSGQGYTYSPPTYSSHRVKLDYIILPVMAKFYLYKNSFALETGPQVGFLVSAKQTTPSGYKTIQHTSDVDFGVNAGLNYELKNGVFFQGRYNLGLTNTKANADYTPLRVNNAVIQVSVGYLF